MNTTLVGKILYITTYGRCVVNDFYLIVEESADALFVLPLQVVYASGDAFDGLERPVIPAEINAAQGGLVRVTKSAAGPFVTENGRRLELWDGRDLPCHEA